MKNCEEYVDAWLKNVEDADEIIVQDGGSIDGTVQRLLEAMDRIPNMSLILQREDSEKFKWNEEAVRNQFLGMFKTDWILLMDADELVSDNFWSWFRNTDHNKDNEKIGYYIPHHNLWLDWGQFNIKEPWYPDLTLRLFKNHRGFFWVGSEHASLWRMGQTKTGTGMCSPQDPDTPVIPDSYFVHYHRSEPGYKQAILEDRIPHHSGEKDNMTQTPILARLRSHPKGAELIRKRFE
jgi:glycosyltransferase involved in cell wall biosynthesis